MPEHPHAVHFTKDQRRPTARRIHVEEDLLKVAEQIQQSDSRSKKHIASITPTINSDAKADGLTEEKLKELGFDGPAEQNK
ncbi:hypothetical protein TrVE_jg12754 [Triparma verrucosa]|uniref:Uncharacterized protein n=1 Tax=Triparma verrucosa TaxID=1606542 RepID=A0A9W7EZS5_9STRA|nr:hypothetical protein TrVE_jg12754 [Triparma verrucosa]